MAEALIEGIEQDAQAEAGRLLSEAERRAREIRDGAAARAQAMELQAGEKAELRAKQVLERGGRSVEAELKKLRLRAKDDLRRELLASVRKTLAGLPGRDDYPEVLLSWLVEAAEGTGAGSAVVYAGKREREILKAGVLEKARSASGVELSLADESGGGETGGAAAVFRGHRGVIVTDRDGRVVYDNSIEARMKRMETGLRRLIDRELQ